MRNFLKDTGKNVKHRMEDVVDHLSDEAHDHFDKSHNDRFIWFITGLTFGIIGALLLAPKTGSELRGDIKEGTQELVSKAEKKIKGALGSVDEEI